MNGFDKIPLRIVGVQSDQIILKPKKYKFHMHPKDPPFSYKAKSQNWIDKNSSEVCLQTHCGSNLDNSLAHIHHAYAITQ